MDLILVRISWKLSSLLALILCLVTSIELLRFFLIQMKLILILLQCQVLVHLLAGLLLIDWLICVQHEQMLLLLLT